MNSKNKSSRTTNVILVGVFIVLIGFLVYLAGSFLYSRLPKKAINMPQNNQEQTTPAPAVDEKAGLDDIAKKQEDSVKTLFTKGKGWDPEKFDVEFADANESFIVVNIKGKDTSIPNGQALIYTPEKEDKIIYDSTTKDPCSLLDSKTTYPSSVTGKCK